MFVRFVIQAVDKKSGRRAGLFQKAYALRRANELPPVVHDRLDAALNWLDHHLKIPERFSRGKTRREAGLAICWFKDSACDYIAQMRVSMPSAQRVRNRNRDAHYVNAQAI